LRCEAGGREGADLHGGRGHSRAERDLRAGVSAIRHVNVRMISQGASEINMSFMIEESDVEEAVRALHKEFFSAPDPSVFDTEAKA